MAISLPSLDLLNGLSVSLVAAIAGGLIILNVTRSKRGPSLPSPKGIPVFGNLLQLEQKQEWLQFTAWSKELGDIYAVNILGKQIVMLNSMTVIRDLFERRSNIYSSRPPLVVAGELMGWNEGVILSPYNERFKTYRRLLKHGLNPNATTQYWPLIEEEVSRSMISLAKDPESFVQVFKRTAGTVALKIAYGFTDDTPNFATIIKDAELAMQSLTSAGLPGIFLADSVPFLKYLPSWLPGASFQKIAAEGRRLRDRAMNIPFETLRSDFDQGKAKPSFALTLLNEPQEEPKRSDKDIKWVAGALYGGQVDTSVAALSTFVLAMMLHPEAQQRAQAEIDAYIGPSMQQLPTIRDRPRLSYVDAVLNEVLRWHPTVPMVSHSLIQDDRYGEYLLPQDTVLIANIWAATHDPELYRHPDEFQPERFMSPRLEPSSIPLAFGFGRRVCPGQAVAESFLFQNIVCILTLFKIEKVLKEDGEAIEPTLEWSSGITSHPAAFKCKITPRSPAAAALLHALDEE